MDKLGSNYVGIPSRAEVRQTVHDNSGKIAAGGAIGTATFATIKNSARIGNNVVKVVNESQMIQAANKAKILKIFSSCKFLRNPLIQRIAGPLAGFAALSSVVGSTAKVVDTCNYISKA